MLIEQGGIVMIPLFGLSVVSVALIIERAAFWWRTNKPQRIRRINRLNQWLAANDPKAEAIIAADESVYGVVARAITKARPSDSVVISTVEAERPRLERFMVTLSTIITAAPLLGILGTVLGIIQSFDLLGGDDVLADPRAVSAGIAQALLTTALGLVVTLVTLLPYMIFKGQVDRTLGRIEALVAAAREGADRRDGKPGETADRGDRTTGVSAAAAREAPAAPVARPRA